MFVEKDFIVTDTPSINQNYVLQEEAPSNIALVKYWGKYDHQIPMNPSISFTLNKSKTITKAILTKRQKVTPKINFKFYLNDIHQPDFEPKIARFFEKIREYVPFISHFDWTFYSQNTFPHSSGIASSASGFATLAKLIMALERQLFPPQSEAYYLAKTSFLARLGSGSAARSTQHPVMIWGKHPKLPGTTDLYAITPDFEIHPVFNNYKDSIVLVEKGQKQVSSTAGHQLMDTHPYKEIRKKQAYDHTLEMTKILQSGDLEKFIELTEKEALTLHALMMTSNPNYILMQPDTLKIIKAIRAFRNREHIPVCFTLDAGANVHILYPAKFESVVSSKLFSKFSFEIIKDFAEKNC